MKFLPLDTPERVEQVAAWLAEPRNYQWLDFGNGVQTLSAATLRIMVQKDVNFLRLFTADDEATPAGVVGLSNVDRKFKTANLWIVLGDKQFSFKGLAVKAVSRMIRLGFTELGLDVVQCWCVAGNHASRRLIRLMNFQPVGLLRHCHRMEGKVYDRELFDLLQSEFTGVADA